MSGEYEAGPGLDRQVAEQVLGWRYEPRFPGDAAGYLVTPTERIIYEEWPEFSTDMGAAWQVVERLRDLHEPGSFAVLVGALPTGDYYCKAVTMGAWDSTYPIHADTAPLAICRAALAALEGSHGE